MYRIETIRKNIAKSISKHKIKAVVSIEYAGTAISVREVDGAEPIYIWIRIQQKYNNTLCVYICNVELPHSKRRQGVFTTIFSNLQKCKYIDELYIMQVCSSAMRSWCEKHR